jgi:DNA primase small subunit
MDADEWSTRRFLRQAFHGYYMYHWIEPPARLTLREFAVVNFGENFMRRHKGFQSTDELHDWLKGISHYEDGMVSDAYSEDYTAYYDHPGARTMAEKGWQGADLIFDLDADHLKGVEGMTFPEQLDQVKVMVKRLIDDFLMNDFGFDERHLEAVFSGGRGYHIHINDPRVLSMDSHCRRQVVDYIEGTGLNMDNLCTVHVIGLKNPGTKWQKDIRTREIPKPDEIGWRGRFTRGVISVAKKLSGMNEKDAVKYLMSIDREDGKRLGRKSAREIYITVNDHIEDLAKGVIDFFENDRLLNLWWGIIQAEATIHVQGETDEPVTTDVKRLIRLPTSLHGKTGLVVAPVKLQDLDKFNPLTDALAFNNHPWTVTGTKDGTIPLGGQIIEVHAGETLVVPTYAAVFGAARGMLSIPGRGIPRTPVCSETPVNGGGA